MAHEHHGHHGHGEEPEQIDWTTQADRLVKMARDDADWYAEIAELLWRPTDRLVVDFACGGAGMATALSAKADGKTRVVGVDRDPAMYGAVAKSLPGVDFATGSFEDSAETLRAAIGDEPDLIWARHAVHHAEDAQVAIDTLTELLAPGGRLVLGEGGLSPRFLPYDLGIGEAGMEDGLHAANHKRMTGIAHHVRIPYGWPVALRHAGLSDVSSRTLLTDHPAPLTGADLDRALNTLGRYVDWNRENLEADTLALWNRLLDPADEIWLGRREDVYHLDANTIHIGHKPG